MKHTYTLLVFMILLRVPIIHAQNENSKAIFVYNFTKYIEWPIDGQLSEFTITVLGESNMVSELEGATKQHQVSSKHILIKKVETISAISQTNIVFVTKDKTSEIAELVQLAISKHILLITEKPNACSLGSAINFISKNGNLSFEIHRTNLEKSGLKVNSQLLNLGTVVQF